MTILVTGGAGYIGSHFVLACLDAGREVVVLDDLSTGHAGAVPGGVPLHVGSCEDHATLDRVWRAHGIRSVVHFAARTSVPESVAAPLRYYAANLCASASLLSFCAPRRPRAFVFSSSAAVYGGGHSGAIRESASCVPASPYGRSKLMTEHIIADAARAHAMPAATLRYFNVGGADPHGRAGHRSAGAAHLIKRICEVATGERPHLDVYGTDYDTPDGTCVRDYVHVCDLARAHLLALDRLAEGSERLTLNVGTGRGVSVAEAAAAGARAAHRAIPLRPAPRRAGDVARVVADPGALMDGLGWRPAHVDIGEMIATALDFESRHCARRAA